MRHHYSEPSCVRRALKSDALRSSQVAPVHLMHSAWAISVCLANGQNAGMLATAGIPAEAGISRTSQAKLVPFVFVTALQAFLGVTSFLLCSNQPAATEGVVKAKAPPSPRKTKKA